MQWLFVEKTRQSRPDLFRHPSFTFPDDQYAPPEFNERFPVSAIAVHVRLSFGGPELGAGGRLDSSEAALMAMPKAAMNEYNRTMLRQDNIWFTREVLTMELKAIPQRVKDAPNGKLRFSVLPANRSHVAASLLGSVDVNHHASPAFSCLPRTRVIKPAKSRSHVLCCSLYVS